MNIVVSRRRLIEERRELQKKRLLENLQESDVLKGVVKNIAHFGAFVDLGGLDGSRNARPHLVPRAEDSLLRYD